MSPTPTLVMTEKFKECDVISQFSENIGLACDRQLTSRLLTQWPGCPPDAVCSHNLQNAASLGDSTSTFLDWPQGYFSFGSRIICRDKLSNIIVAIVENLHLVDISRLTNSFPTLQMCLCVTVCIMLQHQDVFLTFTDLSCLLHLTAAVLPNLLFAQHLHWYICKYLAITAWKIFYILNHSFCFGIEFW